MDHQEGDFPAETSDNSESGCEESSEIDSEEENCSATALIDALSDIPNQSKFHDLNSDDKLPSDFLLQSFRKVSLLFGSFFCLKVALHATIWNARGGTFWGFFKIIVLGSSLIDINLIL